MSTHAPTRSGEQTSSAPTGLSEFLSKVLDQLSLTSWLPAAMLVGTGAVLVEFYAQEKPSLVGAVASLTDNAVGLAVVLLFGVVLAAVVTQAFSFETIRLLEGYWGLSARTRSPLERRTTAHAAHRDDLITAVETQRRTAFEHARSAMCADRIPVALIEVLEDDFYDRSEEERRPHAPEITMAARLMGWRVKAQPAALATLDRLERRLAEYPARHRVLPTRLGNVIRAAEDRVEHNGHDLEGLIMRNYEVIPPRLMEQHDQFRDRLDMYCTLIPVFAMLGLAFAGLALRGREFIVTAGVGAVTAIVLALVSYQAAIASSRGYSSALTAISVRVPRPVADQPV